MEKNEQFEYWYGVFFIKQYSNRGKLIDGTYVEFFNQLPPSMQWGVYLEFFDSVGIVIEIEADRYQNSIMGWKYYISGSSVFYNTRQEAQTEAIKKAFEILNSK
jgi:hypothetical protein